MMKRVVLAAVLGGLAMFVWGFVSHMLLPIGMMGMRSMPQDREEALLMEMKKALPEDGLYIFPGMDFSASLSAEQKELEMEKLTQKSRRGPRGLLIYHPGGGEMMEPGQLVAELVSDIACALVAAFLLATASLRSYSSRVYFVTLLGLLSVLSIEMSYRIWYEFPTEYLMGQLIDQVVGFFLAGLVVAGVIKPPTR